MGDLIPGLPRGYMICAYSVPVKGDPNFLTRGAEVNKLLSISNHHNYLLASSMGYWWVEWPINWGVWGGGYKVSEASAGYSRGLLGPVLTFFCLLSLLGSLAFWRDQNVWVSDNHTLGCWKGEVNIQFFSPIHCSIKMEFISILNNQLKRCFLKTELVTFQKNGR